MFTNGIRNENDIHRIAFKMSECFYSRSYAYKHNADPHPAERYYGGWVSNEGLEDYDLEGKVSEYLESNFSEDYASYVESEHYCNEYGASDGWDEAELEVLANELTSIIGTDNEFLGWKYVAE